MELIYDNATGKYYLKYGDAKKMGVKAGSTFEDCGSTFRATEYVNWLPCQNRQFSGFCCEEI